MARYLIEVPHEANKDACEQAIRMFLNTGSHFMTNADWGCLDGEHKAWFVIDIEDKEQARHVLPPAFRPKAKIIELNKFSVDKMDVIKSYHTK